MQEAVQLERPGGHASRCAAQYPGCNQIPDLLWRCETEGAGIYLCHGCAQRWRAQITLKQELGRRCPRCKDIALPQVQVQANTGQAGREGAAHPPAGAAAAPTHLQVPLVGAAASAIDSAMHREGILAPDRQRVLNRLREDASWLGSIYVSPDAVALLEGHLLSPTGETI